MDANGYHIISVVGKLAVMEYKVSVLNDAIASIMKKKFIDKIDNIRGEFPSLEANLPSYSFISMDSAMTICTTSLYHFDRVTDSELKKF